MTIPGLENVGFSWVMLYFEWNMSGYHHFLFFFPSKSKFDDFVHFFIDALILVLQVIYQTSRNKRCFATS